MIVSNTKDLDLWSKKYNEDQKESSKKLEEKLGLKFRLTCMMTKTDLLKNN